MRLLHALPVLSLLALTSSVAHADEAPPAPPAAPAPKKAEEHEEKKPLSAYPENVVFADLGLHVIGLGYQRKVSPHVAISISGNFYDPWTVTDKLGDVRGGVLRVRPYFFLLDEAPRGPWISPFFQGGVVRGERNGESKIGPAGALGAAIGYAFLFADRVHLSLGVGGQLHAAYIPDSSRKPSFYTAGLHVDATLGFAF